MDRVSERMERQSDVLMVRQRDKTKRERQTVRKTIYKNSGRQREMKR
jgi:hypothetical protein